MTRTLIAELDRDAKRELQRMGDDLRTARFLRGVGDPTRIAILRLVEERERSVAELVDLTGAPQGRISNHLRALRRCGYVLLRPDGRQHMYSVSDTRIATLIQTAERVIEETAIDVDGCDLVASTSVDRVARRVGRSR